MKISDAVMGGTYQIGSDSYKFEVVSTLSLKRKLVAKVADDGTLYDMKTIFLNKRGLWKETGKYGSCGIYTFGEQVEYLDPSF